jgi:branched-chain amino acid transport system permease protein
MMRSYRPYGFILFGVWCVALFLTPLWADNYVIRIAITMAMFSALALSWPTFPK